MTILKYALIALIALLSRVAAAQSEGKPGLVEPIRTFAEVRVALVVGNGDYSEDAANPGGVPDLPNAVSDARAIRDMLSGLGFRIVYGENLAKRQMERAMAQFAEVARESEVAITYFAGHGATFGDRPYLVPTDAEFASIESVVYELIGTENFIAELRRASGVRLALIDACRDNDKEQQLKRQQGGPEMRGGEPTRGLARVERADGLIIAYATQFLTTASDGDLGNSPFVRALVDRLPEPGIDIRQALFNVADQVVQETGGAQRPEIAVSLFTPFELVPGEARDAEARPPDGKDPVGPEDRSVEIAFWNSIATSDNNADFEAYLAEFPNGTFAALAANRLAALQPGAPDQPPAAPEPAPPATAGEVLRGFALEGVWKVRQTTRNEAGAVGTYVQNRVYGISIEDDGSLVDVSRSGSRRKTARATFGANAENSDGERLLWEYEAPILRRTREGLTYDEVATFDLSSPGRCTFKVEYMLKPGETRYMALATQSRNLLEVIEIMPVESSCAITRTPSPGAVIAVGR